MRKDFGFISKMCLASFATMVLLTGCAAGGNQNDAGQTNEMTEMSENAASNELSTASEAIDIQVLKSGEAYVIDDRSSVLETYEEYNIQVAPEEVCREALHENYDSIELMSHIVKKAEGEIAESGKYDVTDSVRVKVKFADTNKVLPQTVTKDVIFVRDAETKAWEIKKEKCSTWDADYKKFGGSAWKLTTDNGDVYFRLRDVTEFFSIQADLSLERVTSAGFFTSFVGAMYINTDGEDQLRRIHIMSGTLSDNGDVKLNIEFVHEDESMEIFLNDCVRIEKEELPFSEEEFRKESD